MGIHHWPEVITGIGVGMTIMGVLWAVFSRPSGVLMIDRSDPVRDRYRFDISEEELVNLHKKKRLILVVDPNADLSQD